jgi:hypothetical protein
MLFHDSTSKNEVMVTKMDYIIAEEAKLFNHEKNLNSTVIRIRYEDFSFFIDAHVCWIIQAALFPAHARLPA